MRSRGIIGPGSWRERGISIKRDDHQWRTCSAAKRETPSLPDDLYFACSLQVGAMQPNQSKTAAGRSDVSGRAEESCNGYVLLNVVGTDLAELLISVTDASPAIFTLYGSGVGPRAIGRRQV